MSLTDQKNSTLKKLQRIEGSLKEIGIDAEKLKNAINENTEEREELEVLEYFKNNKLSELGNKTVNEIFKYFDLFNKGVLNEESYEDILIAIKKSVTLIKLDEEEEKEDSVSENENEVISRSENEELKFPINIKEFTEYITSVYNNNNRDLMKLTLYLDIKIDNETIHSNAESSRIKSLKDSNNNNNPNNKRRFTMNIPGINSTKSELMNIKGGNKKKESEWYLISAISKVGNEITKYWNKYINGLNYLHEIIPNVIKYNKLKGISLNNNNMCKIHIKDEIGVLLKSGFEMNLKLKNNNEKNYNNIVKHLNITKEIKEDIMIMKLSFGYREGTNKTRQQKCVAALQNICDNYLLYSLKNIDEFVKYIIINENNGESGDKNDMLRVYIIMNHNMNKYMEYKEFPKLNEIMKEFELKIKSSFSFSNLFDLTRENTINNDCQVWLDLNIQMNIGLINNILRIMLKDKMNDSLLNNVLKWLSEKNEVCSFISSLNFDLKSENLLEIVENNRFVKEYLNSKDYERMKKCINENEYLLNIFEEIYTKFYECLKLMHEKVRKGIASPKERSLYNNYLCLLSDLNDLSGIEIINKENMLFMKMSGCEIFSLLPRSIDT